MALKTPASELFNQYLDAFVIERTGNTMNGAMQSLGETRREKCVAMAAESYDRAYEAADALSELPEPSRSEAIMITLAGEAKDCADAVAKIGGWLIKIG